MNDLTINCYKQISAENADFARDCLAKSMFIREFEAKALTLTQGNPPLVAGSMHFCTGQELVAVAAVAGLGPHDQILSTYRGHGWALAAGLDPEEVFAEICQKASGLNGGRAGSAFFMAPGTRFVGENSIVGAGTTIACGIALANLAAKNGRVVTVSIGDGALNQGAVHEAMAFAVIRNLPVIFVVENNGWSEFTTTQDMFRIDRLAQRASGYGMPSETISGVDAVAVRDTFHTAAERARSGQGPTFLECKVPRLSGHYSRDIQHYRSKEDRAEAASRDPIVLLSRDLIESGLMAPGEPELMQRAQFDRIEAIATGVLSGADPEMVSDSLQVVCELEPKVMPEVIETDTLSYIQAVNTALRTELENDSRTVIFGEDVGKSGGIFGATRRLQRDFGSDRVFDTPIAENAILGAAVGAAMNGLKPIVEIMWADFIFVALDQLVNQAANIRFITGGESSVPMVVRTQQGATPGSCAQHSQCIEAILAHIPGLKVALAATAQDAYALIRSASADPDPCIVIEARALYQTKSTVSLTQTAEPIGVARQHRNGRDVVILTWGTMVLPSIEAAERLELEGLSVGVLDLRWLSPLDKSAICQGVRDAGGRVLIVHEAVKTGGFGGELMARIYEWLGQDLPLKIQRLCALDSRIPAAPTLQRALLPNAETIAEAAMNVVKTCGETDVKTPNIL